MKSGRRSAGIAGTGFYVPDKILTNLDLEKIVDTTDEWIRTRTGIRERRIADVNEATSDLAVKAARKALEDARTCPQEIDLIIVATTSPDMLFPPTACFVQKNIGAEKSASFDVSAACSGFIYGLSIANAYIKNGDCGTVLLIGAEAISKIIDWQDRDTCVLFGDGAGAVVLRQSKYGSGILGNYLGADGSGTDLLKLPAGGSRLPASHETVRQRSHYIKMNGKQIYKFAIEAMTDAIIKVLEKTSLLPEDIDLFIPHQANVRIIESVAKNLNLPKEKVAVNVDRYGNTSAASIPIALCEAVKQGRIREGDIVVLAAFGAGLTWGVSVIRW